MENNTDIINEHIGEPSNYKLKASVFCVAAMISWALCTLIVFVDVYRGNFPSLFYASVAMAIPLGLTMFLMLVLIAIFNTPNSVFHEFKMFYNARRDERREMRRKHGIRWPLTVIL